MLAKTLLVDASYLLKKGINGNKDTYTMNFGHYGGVYTFFTILRKLIKDHKINKVVLAWDGENGGIYRHKIDRKYKANRENKSWYEGITLTDRDIEREEKKRQSTLKQKIRIQQYAEELYLRQIQVNEIEADDIIAQYCKDYHSVEDIILYTNDRDFCQLLEYDINILFGNKKELINKNNFFMHFTYNYQNALTMKIITGDASDNIEGIGGLKEKSLLNYFPDLVTRKISVREICSEAKKINEERLINKKKPYKNLDNLINGLDRLKLNYMLMNLFEPILNNDAIEELEQLKEPLDLEGRSSTNLFNMMRDDGFFEVYESSFSTYVEPFYSVIMFEKMIYKKNME